MSYNLNYKVDGMVTIHSYSFKHDNDKNNINVRLNG